MLDSGHDSLLQGGIGYMRRLAVCFSGFRDYPKTALGPHASRVPPPATNEPPNTTLGAPASSVLPSATNKSKGANKARKFRTPASSLPHGAARSRRAGTSVVPLFNTGQSADTRPFSLVSLPHAPALNCDDITAVLPLHISRRNPVSFNNEVSAVPALHNSANVPLSDPASAPLKIPSISAVTAEESRPRMVVQVADEMASHLMPSGCGPIEKSGKISTNSTNSMISMLTHVEIGVVAPGRPLQFERGHSTDPNAMRPQFSTEKSVKTSANGAGAAKPTNKGNGSSAPAHPWAFKPDNTPLKTPPKTVVTVADARTGVRSLVGGRATAGSPATAPSASFKASNIGRGLRLNARRLGD
jgi:hypothetical protein